MLELRKRAREVLNGSSLTDFNALVKEAKISDESVEILTLKFVRGMSVVQIADRCHCSVEKVKYTIQKSYDKIFKLL